MNLLPYCAILLMLGLAHASNHLCMRVIARSRWSAAAAETAAYPTIEGLRGYLALGVFFHHGSVWIRENREGIWTQPDAHFLTNLGDTSVTLFFMITAFLFVGKVLDSRDRPIDWLHLYRARLFRMGPMYALVVLAMLVVVGVLTHWSMHDSPRLLLRTLLGWASFGILGFWDINGVLGTRHILAGVVWTLTYEWAFYLMLPVLAVLLNRRCAPWALLLSAVSAAVLILYWEPEIWRLAPFLGGAVAAWFVRRPALKAWTKRPGANALVLGLIAWQMTTQSSAYEAWSLLALTFAFCLIASGCSLFGVLASTSSRHLGLPTYSIYLLHGLLLYVAFRFVFSPAESAGLSDEAHWAVVLALTPMLIGLSHLGYWLVERPFMEWARGTR